MSYIEALSNTVAIFKASSIIKLVTLNTCFLLVLTDQTDTMAGMKREQLHVYESKYYKH